MKKSPEFWTEYKNRTYIHQEKVKCKKQKPCAGVHFKLAILIITFSHTCFANFPMDLNLE